MKFFTAIDENHDQVKLVDTRENQFVAFRLGEVYPDEDGNMYIIVSLCTREGITVMSQLEYLKRTCVVFWEGWCRIKEIEDQFSKHGLKIVLADEKGEKNGHQD